MPAYRLTNAADVDLTNIITYGVTHFGETATVSFYEGLISVIESIARNPTQYPFAFSREDSYQKAVYNSYAIFFVAKPNYVEITRVLRKENYDQLLD